MPSMPVPPGARAKPPVLRLRGITKRFGSLVANDDISLDLARGEVLALLGENGAGKSTLVSILFGHYVADAGTVEVDGRPLPPGDTRAALRAGVGMVHQHFTLADNLSVLDNVMLGSEPLWQPLSRRGDGRRRLLETAQRFGLQVEPDAQVSRLSVGERQRVEILKALVPVGRRAAARVLILDEPTAVLTPQESESLFATLGQLVASGLAVIFISHKLDEVLRVSHRVAVLRGGKLVEQLRTADADKPRLAEAMVGREIAPPRKQAATPGAVVCRLRGATVRAPRAAGGGVAARPLLDGIDLELRAGEVLAIAGVAGNGQDTLAEVLGGQQRLDAGTLEIAGLALPASPRAFVEAGVARVPEDRQAVGVVGDLPLWENVVLERHASAAFARWGVMRRERAMAHARELVKRFDVRGAEAAGVATTTRALSGGNMQKLILGRALAGNPDAQRAPLLIVANQPTWGLDVGAVAYVHQQVLDACAQGSAVLLISEDLDEIFALADRIAVLYRGRLVAARPTADWTLTSIGLAMGGQSADAQPDTRHAA